MGSTSPGYARIRLAFGASSYFRELPAASLDALACAATIERCERGGVIHRAGEPMDKFWLVIEGALLVLWIDANLRSVPVAIFGEGSYYSVASLVDGGVPNSECRAERDTVGATIPSVVMRELQEGDPAIRALIPKLLLQRLQAILVFYADSVSARLPERLARRLLAQALTTCRRSTGEIELRISQTDLAGILGASRPKLNAELRRMEESGLLRLGYRRVYIRDLEGLAKVAGAGVPIL